MEQEKSIFADFKKKVLFYWKTRKEKIFWVWHDESLQAFYTLQE